MLAFRAISRDTLFGLLLAGPPRVPPGFEVFPRLFREGATYGYSPRASERPQGVFRRSEPHCAGGRALYDGAQFRCLAGPAQRRTGGHHFGTRHHEPRGGRRTYTGYYRRVGSDERKPARGFRGRNRGRVPVHHEGIRIPPSSHRGWQGTEGRSFSSRYPDAPGGESTQTAAGGVLRIGSRASDLRLQTHNLGRCILAEPATEARVLTLALLLVHRQADGRSRGCGAGI